MAISPRAGLLPAVVAVVAVVAGCGGEATTSGDGAPAGAPSTTPTATASPSSSAVAPAVAPTRDDERLVVPPETAGDLDSGDLPAPPDLGAGWRQFADPGDPEEGYAGNGSWVRARGGAEVVQALLPLGCAGLREMPRLPEPRHALEATYRGPGRAPAVALVLSYGSVGAARELVTTLGDVGASCAAPEKPVKRSDPLVAVVTQERADDSVVLDRRREYGAGASGWVWSEAVVRRGDRVGLLTVASPPGPDRPELTKLADAVRRSLGG